MYLIKKLFGLTFEYQSPDAEDYQGDFFSDDDDDIIFNPAVKRAPNKTGVSPKHYHNETDRAPDPKEPDPKDHRCEEGMTEIGGWIICKHCGSNLRRIR